MIRQMRKLLAAVGGTGVFAVLVILRSPFDTVYMLVQAIFLNVRSGRFPAAIWQCCPMPVFVLGMRRFLWCCPYCLMYG